MVIKSYLQNLQSTDKERFSNTFKIGGKKAKWSIVSFIILILLLKTETIWVIFNPSGKVSVDMELYIQFVTGSTISSFTILTIFAGISPLELLLQSISAINWWDLWV